MAYLAIKERLLPRSLGSELEPDRSAVAKQCCMYDRLNGDVELNVESRLIIIISRISTVHAYAGSTASSVCKPCKSPNLTNTTHSHRTEHTLHSCKQNNYSRCHSHRRDSRRPCHDNCSERHIIHPTYRPLVVFTPHPSSLASPLHNHQPLSPLASSTEPGPS